MIIWYNYFGDNMLDEIIKLDSTFTESSFKTKVDNIFVMLHTSLMTDNLKRVAHFINDKVYSEFNSRLQELNNNNQRQMFDELNVKSTEIENVEITNDKYIISWDNARNDSVVYDLINLYRKNYNEVDFYNLFILCNTERMHF